MSKGLALTIGLNSVDPKSYGGWPGYLKACEADAQDMTSIAKSQGFEVTSLLTNAATRENVQEKIGYAAQNLKAGDIFMISYAGHGGQLPDHNDDEPDALDETWCLYDGEIVDDELYALYGQFAEGVRILVFSDSCHSGSVTRAAYYRGLMDVRTSNIDKDGKQYRFMPSDVVFHTYRLNKEFYDKILRRADLRGAEGRVKSPVLLISGCQDNQYSQDGAFNGLFTSQLLAVWKEGAFQGDYRSFHKDIVGRMPPDQTPNYFVVGGKVATYEKQRPFTI
ncbi:MAG: caspase family protein [Nitrososphaera sp.]|nr:caspase family protein [Nitrososphaera sp.]